MARGLRVGGPLLLVLVAGCSAASPQHPAQLATQEQIMAATPTALTDSTPAAARPAPTISARVRAGATVAPLPTNLESDQALGAAPAAPMATGSTPAQPDLTSPAVDTSADTSVAAAGANSATAPSPDGALPDATLPDGTQPAPSQAAPDPACDGSARLDPLPPRGSPASQDFFRAFRAPLAPAPLYDPPGPRRVGLQAGHWLTEKVPPELGRLQGGAVGGGRQEWEVNLDIAGRTAQLLEAANIQVDVLPATVPPGYRANAFIALHADGDPAGVANGFKVARPGFSSLPDVDDRLVETLNQVYGADTELPRDDAHISLRMRYYYAFNSRRYCHAVAPGVPQAIIELGYLSSPLDRRLLIDDPGRLARALADAIQTFLTTIP